MITTAEHELTADAFAERLFGAYLGAMETLGHYLGERLGWYAALAAEPLTPPALAATTGTAPRYAREWCEWQAANGAQR